MPNPFLLTRVLLQFNDDDDDLLQELSAAAIDRDGFLWTGSDEYMSVERLSACGDCHFADHRAFALADFVDLPKDGQEVDIEGLAYDGGFLWVCGSHSTKRKKPKEDGDAADDLKRLAKIKREKNRYLLARIPIHEGQPVAVVETADGPRRQAAALERTRKSNLLIEALTDDPHLGPFLENKLPGKENGFDIEGIAAQGDRAWIGLRGPVLIGWAFIIELQVKETKPGVLGLEPIGEGGRPYRKHLVKLDGLGIRDLLCWGDDLLILAGPSMDLTGSLRVYRLSGLVDRKDNSLAGPESGDLERMIDLPFETDGDKAEGMVLYPFLGEEALLIVYDSPHPRRRPCAHGVYADVFRLPRSSSSERAQLLVSRVEDGLLE